MKCSTQRIQTRILLLAAIALSALVADASTVGAASDSHILRDIPVTPQAWSLSCEYAATSAATAMYGPLITQWRLRASIETAANPHKGFRGDITGAGGGTTDYGVYAEPIAAVLHRYGFSHSYVFYGGAVNLRAEIAAEHPVVVWVTGTWKPSSRQVLRDAEGDSYSLIPGEHAVTVYGYDTDGVWVMDPAGPDRYHVSWDRFLAAWDQFDGMALVVAM
jgi:uncharacterized protein YvpB